MYKSELRRLDRKLYPVSSGRRNRVTHRNSSTNIGRSALNVMSYVGVEKAAPPLTGALWLHEIKPTASERSARRCRFQGPDTTYQRR